MKKGKSQAQRMKGRAQSAEHEVAAKDQEIAKLREQLDARNPGPSSTTTPPGRGTPSQRNPASRPQREDRSSQASIPKEAKGEEPDGDESDGDSGEGDGDLRGDRDGGDEDAGVRSDSEEEKQEDDDHDMKVLQQLAHDVHVVILLLFLLQVRADASVLVATVPIAPEVAVPLA